MKACVFTVGCKMNSSESKSLMRGLEERGYEVSELPEPADLYILNTCAVTAEAEKKSRQAVARMRKYNPGAPVIVCGCAAQHSPESFSRIAGVTAVTGTMRKDRIFELLDKKGEFLGSETEFCELPMPARARTRAFLRIQDGCNRFCSYCIIPYLRGRSRSRNADSVREEAITIGAKEIVLTGIDISSYHDGENDLAGLISKLKGVPARIRLGSLEASAITEEFLSACKETGVMPQFHVCLQSGSDRVLRAMNRKYTQAEYLAACEKIYAAFPDAAITTDIIAGFPAETDEDVAETVAVMRKAGFSRMHVFPFSAREGTAAAKLPDLPAEVKEMRCGYIAKIAEEVADGFLDRFIGKEAVVLFESGGEGYTENYIRVRAEGARENTLCRVRITGRKSFGTEAEILEVIDG